MKTKTYNNKDLIAYLLGSLPEDEVELFDELSFIDDDFAAELNAAEKDLIDAFINGELEGAELERFNTYFLASPRRREKVDFAQSFQEFAENKIAEIDQEASVEAAKPVRQPAGFLSRLNIFKFQRPALQWGFALAALTLMILGGWLWAENSRLRWQAEEATANREDLLRRETELKEREKQLQDEIASQRSVNSETENELAQVKEERERLTQELKNRQLQEDRQRITEQRTETQKTPVSESARPPIVAFFTLLPSLRGGTQLPTVSLPAQTNAVGMRLELESDDYTTYRVVLRNQSGDRNLWQSGRLKSKTSGGGKVLNVRFAASLLKSQIYTLEVSGFTAAGGTEIIGDYSFQVMR